MTARRPFVRGLAGASAVAMFLACSSIAAPAAAQPAKPAASSNAHDAAMAEARARFEEGIKQAEAGDHDAARLKFNQAWALLKSPAILYNLARAEQLSGHPVEALEHYRQFAKLPPDPKVTDAQRQRAAEGITELSKKVGQIEIEAPATARVTVDGRTIEPGNTDPVPVTPGKHVVEAIADGKVKSVTVECSAGTIAKAKLSDSEPGTGVAASPQPPPATASKESSSAPGSSGTASPADERPGFWTGGRIAGVGVFVGGLAALGAGLVFNSMAASSEEEANEIRNGLPEPRESACNDDANGAQCAQLKKNVDDQNLRQDLRTGFFIGGGVLVVGGAVLFLLSSPKSETTQTGARVVPFATARDAGLAVVGRF